MQIPSHYFNLNTCSKECSLRNFHFRLQNIPTIAKLTGRFVGRTIRNRYRCDPITACCLVLRKLAVPCRWKDLETTFGMMASAMSEVFWEVIESLVQGKGHLVRDLQEFMLVPRANLYAEAIYSKGAPLQSCIGFIDCTQIKIARPGGHGSLQRSCYSGHKRMHCLVYQTVTTPDGITFYLNGPEVGRRHDTTLLQQSLLSERLEQCLMINGRQYYIYTTAAYMLRTWFQTAFDRLAATVAQLAYNKSMSALRVVMEWHYKDVKQMWSSNDFSRMLKERKANIRLLYTASILLQNFKTCIERGGQLVFFFECLPPTLDEYIGWSEG